MLGWALAHGISLNDFCALTPAALEAVEEEILMMERGAWERARVLYIGSVSPHLRKGANREPSHLLPLPWDSEARRGRPPREKPKKLTREEAKARMDALAAKLKKK